MDNTSDPWSELPSFTYPQDDNPAVTTPSFPVDTGAASPSGATSSGGFFSQATAVLGQLLNYNLQRDQQQNQAALVQKAQTLNTPLSASFFKPGTGQVDLLKLALTAAFGVGLFVVAKKALA